MTAAQAWSPWFVAVWVLWGLAFVALESAGLRRDGDAYPPLTHVVHRYVPAALTIAGVAWLLWHALQTYGVLP
jgi:hypothetical protein